MRIISWQPHLYFRVDRASAHQLPHRFIRLFQSEWTYMRPKKNNKHLSSDLILEVM